MTVVSSKEFASNQKMVYNQALSGRVVIKRGKNMFYLIGANIEDDDTVNDYADLLDAKTYTDDENTTLADFKKYINGLNK